MEMTQDMSGTLGPVTGHRLETVLASTNQLEQELESYIACCNEIESFFQAYQDARMNSTLFTLTTATVGFLPIQLLTGIYGMNFEVMPELHYEYGYPMFWCAAIFFLLSVVVTLVRSRSKPSNSVILLDEEPVKVRSKRSFRNSSRSDTDSMQGSTRRSMLDQVPGLRRVSSLSSIVRPLARFGRSDSSVGASARHDSVKDLVKSAPHTRE